MDDAEEILPGQLVKLVAPCPQCGKDVEGFLRPDGDFCCPDCAHPAVWERWCREWEPIAQEIQREKDAKKRERQRLRREEERREDELKAQQRDAAARKREEKQREWLREKGKAIAAKKAAPKAEPAEVNPRLQTASATANKVAARLKQINPQWIVFTEIALLIDFLIILGVGGSWAGASDNSLLLIIRVVVTLFFLASIFGLYLVCRTVRLLAADFQPR